MLLLVPRYGLNGVGAALLISTSVAACVCHALLPNRPGHRAAETLDDAR